MKETMIQTALKHHAACSVWDGHACTCKGELMGRSAFEGISDGQWAVFAEKVVRERDEARDCGQDGVCAITPGCHRHWQERNRELVRERDELKRLLLIAVDNGGASIRIWQCSGCLEAFSGNYQNKCPSCNSVGYWSGSVDPEARKKLEERDHKVRDVMKIQAIARESR